MRRLPGFFVIGAARAGTTAMHLYLQQHPEIFMSPRKETNYFAFEGESLDYGGPGKDYVNNSVADFEEYAALFADAKPEQMVGEACPLYLYKEGAAERIARRVPDARLIAILRDPVEQAFSHFLYARRQTIEPIADFESALNAQDQRADAHWQPLFQYSHFPKYHAQLERFYAAFPVEQIKIFLYEDFSANPQAVLREIYSFIGVDPEFSADVDSRPNAGGMPKSTLLQDLVMKPHLLNRIIGQFVPEELKRRIRDAVSDRNMDRPEMTPRARERLHEALDDDTRKLQALICRDLSSWLA